MLLALALIVVRRRTAYAQQPSAAALATRQGADQVKGGNAISSRSCRASSSRPRTLPADQPGAQQGPERSRRQLRDGISPPRGEDLLNEVAKLYAARFTEQELKDALAFYKTPLGRKMLTEEPRVLDRA